MDHRVVGGSVVTGGLSSNKNVIRKNWYNMQTFLAASHTMFLLDTDTECMVTAGPCLHVGEHCFHSSYNKST